MGTHTHAMRLAEVWLDRPVLDWIEEQRAAGKSWRLIARDLYEASDGALDVTGEAIRNWAERSETAA